MARRLTVGFESRRFTNSTTTNGEGQNTSFGGPGTPTADTSNQWSGSCCLKCAKNTQTYMAWFESTPAETWQWAQMVFKPGSTWTGDYLSPLGCSIAGHEIGFYFYADGKEVGIFFQGAGEEFWVPDASFTMPNIATEHHIVELGLWPHASNSAKSKVRLVIRDEEGEVIYDHEREGNIGGTGALGSWTFGNLNSPPCDLYVSQVIINDSTGSAENEPVGHQKVVMLKPYTDDSRDAGWLNGGGGTTNLYNAVDNYPPVGVANGSKTATSQVYNATSTTTQTYVARCAGPTDPVSEGGGGMVETDLFTALMVIGRFSNSTSTARGYGLSASFPTVTEKTDSTSGTAGTEPTGWKTTATAPIYPLENDSNQFAGGMEVTEGDNDPRVVIRKNAASTNVLACDMLGVYVSYKPGEAGGGEALMIELADTVAPAESRGKRDAVSRVDALASVADSRSKRSGLARTDSQSLADALKRSVIERHPDTLALAELLKRTVGTSRAETLALADKLARALGIRQGDAAVVVEAMRRRAGLARADSVEASETYGAVADLGKADSFTFGESLVRGEGRGVADGVLLAELLAHAWVAQRDLTDTIPLDDEFVVFLGQTLELEDATALSDALVRVWAATSGLADVLAPADAQALDAALKRADTASVVALISNEAGGHQSDSLSVSDARRLAAGLGVSEHVAVIDAMHPAEGIGIGNMFTLEDAVARTWAASLARADTFDLADTARLAAERSLAEALGVTDADARAWAALREAEDVFAVIDAVETFSTKGTNPHETLKVAEALERVWEAIFDRADAVTVVEVSRLSYGRLLHESVHLPEAHLRELGKHFANQIELAEDLQRSLAARHNEPLEAVDQPHQRLSKTLAELVFAQDARSSHFAEALEEALALAERRRGAVAKLAQETISPSERHALGPSRPLSDAAAFADQMNRAYRLELSESILPLEYRVRSSGLGRADELAISDAIDVLRVLGVILDEALAIADGLRRDSVKALEDLAELEDRVEPHGVAAHEAILVLVDALTTQTLLDDAPEVGLEVADRRSTTLSVEDGLS